MTGLVGAELTKIRTLPAVWVALAIALLANAAVRVARLDTLTLAPVYAFAAIAVLAAGSEYRAGQIRLSLIAVPGRDRFFAAKLLAIATVIPVAAVVVLLPRGAAAGRLLVVHLFFAMIGFGFALLARSIVIPITTLAALPILISTTLGGILPRFVRLLPHEAALSFLRTPAVPAFALRPTAGLLILAAWALGLLAAAWLTVRTRDA